MTIRAHEPVQKQIVVDLPQQRAFAVFTEEMDRWYPREHHIGKSPLRQAVLETRTNGRWYEIGEDGSECEWGKVLVWEPPDRLVLAWQIDANWQYDPAFITEVEVRFIPEARNKTLVKLEHRNIERFGEAADALRDSLDSEAGWTYQLKCYTTYATAP